jgi:hypothetical protein
MIWGTCPGKWARIAVDATFVNHPRRILLGRSFRLCNRLPPTSLSREELTEIKMLRALLIVLLLVILVAIGLFATGYLNINQTREARAPAIEAGQTPAFNVDVQPIEVNTVTKTVQVPVVEMQTKQIQVPTISTAHDAESNSQ